jgi:hypothetical protein
MLTQYGFGEMTVREEVPPRRTPWAFDNGAFKDWKAGKPFQHDKYVRALNKAPHTMDFVAAPDIVEGGLHSLEFSLSWVDRLRGLPLYLVVQDGMTWADVVPHLHHFKGLFVGGTLPWKLETASTWIQGAHSVGLLCHVGRVGTGQRVRLMRKLGADSIDSALPLFSMDNFRKFLAGFRDVDEEVFNEVSGL